MSLGIWFTCQRGHSSAANDGNWSHRTRYEKAAVSTTHGSVVQWNQSRVLFGYVEWIKTTANRGKAAGSPGPAPDRPPRCRCCCSPAVCGLQVGPMATLVQEMRVQLARLEVTSTRQGEQLKTTMGQVAATVSVRPPWARSPRRSVLASDD